MVKPRTRCQKGPGHEGADRKPSGEIRAAPSQENTNALVDGEHDGDEGQRHCELNDADTHAEEYEASKSSLKGIEEIDADLQALLHILDTQGVSFTPEITKLSDQLMAQRGTTPGEARVFANLAQRVLAFAVPLAAQDGGKKGGGLSTVSLMSSIVTASDYLVKALDALDACVAKPKPQPKPKAACIIVPSSKPLH